MQTPFLIHNILVTEVSEGLTGNVSIKYGMQKPIDDVTKKRIGKMLERYLMAEFIGTPPGFDSDSVTI